MIRAVYRCKTTGPSCKQGSHLLAADRVYLLRMSPYVAVVSYTTPFTLTHHPLGIIGGIVSVALSLGLPPVAVSDCHCPMLPGLSSRTKVQAIA